jgi:hypothetical protein
MSVKSRHLSLLLYKIFIPIYAFLPALQNLKNATSFARLPALPRQSRGGDLSGNLSRARTSGSLRGTNPDCTVDGGSVPGRFVFLCSRKQTGKPTGTNFPIFQNLHQLLARMMPHSKLRCNFSDILQSCPMSVSTFCLLRSAAAVLSRPQRGWSVMSVFPSLKCSTHLLTPMQTSPYTPRSHSQMTPTEFPSFTRNSMTAVDETTCWWQAFSRSVWLERKRCACADFESILERENATNGPITLVTIFPPNSS